jgi:hypothetical protein
LCAHHFQRIEQWTGQRGGTSLFLLAPLLLVIATATAAIAQTARVIDGDNA